MIDLIAQGLTLKKRLIITPDTRPQAIRNDSASENQHATMISAISAESASASKEGIDNSYHNEFKSVGCAEVADLAGRQLRRASSVAESLRKHCGLQTVACNDCKYFTPDSIGDGVGIGDCALGVTWTQEYNGRKPLFRYAKRHCSSFSLAMST